MIDADILNLELYRFDLDADVSMAGCMDPMETFRVVSVWLRGVTMSQVSRLAALCYFDIDTLDLSLYRCDLVLNINYCCGLFTDYISTRAHYSRLCSTLVPSVACQTTEGKYHSTNHSSTY